MKHEPKGIFSVIEDNKEWAEELMQKYELTIEKTSRHEGIPVAELMGAPATLMVYVISGNKENIRDFLSDALYPFD